MEVELELIGKKYHLNDKNTVMLCKPEVKLSVTSQYK